MQINPLQNSINWNLFIKQDSFSFKIITLAILAKIESLFHKLR